MKNNLKLLAKVEAIMLVSTILVHIALFCMGIGFPHQYVTGFACVTFLAWLFSILVLFPLKDWMSKNRIGKVKRHSRLETLFDILSIDFVRLFLLIVGIAIVILIYNWESV